jgi:hypothetical protein
MEFPNLFQHTVDVKAMKRQLEITNGKFKILEGLSHAIERLRATTKLNSNTLAKYSIFIQEVDNSSPDSTFYLEVCKLGLYELWLCCIAFEPRRLRPAVKYFAASDIRQFILTTGTVCLERSEISLRL